MAHLFVSVKTKEQGPSACTVLDPKKRKIGGKADRS